MKEIVKKIISFLVIAMLVLNSSTFIIISSAIDKIENVIDENKINGNYEMNLEKYVNYELNDVENTNGVLLQYNLKTGIEYEEGQEYRPLNSTGILLKFPKIEDLYPEKVEVQAISTKATNGNDGAKDWVYVFDKENGEVRIGAFNSKDENGEIYEQNENGARDEYKILCYYSKGLNEDKIKKVKLEITGILQLNINNGEGEIKKKININNTENVKENLSGLISTEISTNDIYKGFVESNAKNGTDYKTDYLENLKVDISYIENYDEATIKINNYLIKNKKEVEEKTEDIIYTKSQINKNDVLDKLGEDGYLKIYNQDGKKLGEINKDTETGEDGFVELKYEEEVTNFEIVISKPKKIGNIEIKSNRQIKETLKDENVKKINIYSDCSFVKNSGIEENTQENEVKTEHQADETKTEHKEEIYNFKNSNIVELKDTESRMDLSVNNTNWTNNVQNDVTFIATLITNNSKYSLYKNPIVEIKLPKEVDKIILNEASLLYDDNLNIDNIEVIDNNEYKIIRISLSGEQNRYVLDSLVDGASIIIPTTIILKKDIATVNDQISFDYHDENNKNHCDEEKREIDISIESMYNQIEEIKIEDNKPAVIENREITENDIELKVKAYIGSKEIIDGDKVYENQIIKYEIKVTNKSDFKIEGINVNGKIPDGTVFGSVDIGTYWDGKYDFVEDDQKREYTFLINSLETNQTVTGFYEVRVKELEDSIVSKDISNKIEMKIQDRDISTKEINNIVEKAKIGVYIKSYIGRDEKNSLHYWIYVKNLTDKTLSNVKIETDEFPKEIIFKEGQLEGAIAVPNFGELKDNKYVAEIDSIPSGGYAQIKLFVNVGNFEDNINEYEAKLSFNALVDGNSYSSNENRRTVYPEYVTVTQTLDKEGEKVEPGTKLNYKVTIKNESKIRTKINILDYLPEKVQGETATFKKWIFPNDDLQTTYDIEEEASKEYEREDVTINISNIILDDKGNSLGNIYYKYLYIPAGRSLEISFSGEALEVSEPTVVSNNMIVSGEYIHTKVSNTVSCTIVPKGYIDPTPTPDPDPNPTPNPDPDPNPNPIPNPDPTPDPSPDDRKYSISGQVWLDKDENGLKNGESNISGITVKLYNADDNKILADENGNSEILTTDENGTYSFMNIPKGRYLVLFEFNTEEYEITKYQVSKDNNYINSNAILKEVSIDGIIKKVGITNIIDVNSESIIDINMGLIYKGKFDLKLDKYVSKIKVTNQNRVKEYNFSEENLAKVEIPAKGIDSTIIEIEYKIRVTNEGNVDGYVTEIIDYLPNGLELNDSNWILNDNGNVYTNMLAGTKIGIGESMEVTVTVTKSLSDYNGGTFINGAEIGKYINIKNLKDIDSIASNKNKLEDDYSEATVIISIKTGLVRNIVLLFLVCLIVSIILYLIYTKKIKIKNVMKMLTFLMVLGVFTSGIVVNADHEGEVDITGWVNDNHIYPGSDGRNYYCMDNGNAMCHIHSHWYKKSGEKTDEDTKEISRVEENVIISKNDSNVRFSVSGGNYVIGPYTMSWNYGDISSVSGQYVTNDGSNVVTHNIQASQMSIRKSGKSATIYFTLPLTTVEVNNLSVKVVHKDGLQITNEKTWRDIYVGTGITGHTHETSQQRMKPVSPDSEPTVSKSDTSATAYFSNKRYWGTSQIIKSDVDTGARLSGARFKIQGGIANITSVGTTDSNGVLQFSKLQPGQYTITEIGAPSGYNLTLQTEKTKITNISADSTSGVSVTNRKYGNLLIEKVDYSKVANGQTGEGIHILYDNETDKQLGNVELDPLVFKDIAFKIYFTKPGDGTKRYIANYSANTSGPSSYTETNQANAQVFKTNNSAQIQLINIPQYYIYHIEEVELTDDMAQYYDLGIQDEAINLNNNYQGANTYYQAKNIQRRIDIAGYVWEDIPKTKASKRDNLYTVPDNTSTTEDDIRIGGVMVYLKKNGVVIAKRRTNTTNIDKTHKIGEYFFPAKGDYEIDDNNPKTYDYVINIAEISQYSIEFEYNGLKYEAVTTNLNAANGSKANEVSQNRINLNGNYHQVMGATQKTTSETQGKTSNNVSLRYTTGSNYNSQLVQNTSYTPESLNGSTDINAGIMYADTKTAGYTFSWTTGIRVIRNVNLGIFEREQPDLAIVTDIDNIKLSINGYEHNYKYQQRYGYVADGIPDKDLNSGYNAVMDGFSVSVKNSNTGNYKTLTYNRDIYDSYIAYTKNDKDNQNRLRMFVTYRIAIKNESSSLISRVSLRNYADSKFKNVDNSYIYGTNQDLTNSWKNIGTVIENETTKNIWETELIAQDIPAGKCKYIYLTYEVSTEGIIELATLSPKGQSKMQIDSNVTEISSYATWDSSGKIYGGIDKDSAPNNITYGNITTYEDDTDSAPDLYFTRKESKQFSGLVYEEGTANSNKLNSGSERIGNGLYDNGEKTIKNVEVKLVEYDSNLDTDNNNVITLYTLDDNGNVITSNAQAITGTDGKYNFTGFVPGEYYIVYTYGKYKYVDMNKVDSQAENKQSSVNGKAVTTQDYKSTIVNENTYRTLIDNDYDAIKSNKLWYWYEDSNNFNKSSAVDNSNIRADINNYLSTITYGRKTDYESEDYNGGHQVMKSYTGIIDVAVEDERSQQTEYDYVEGSRDYQIKFGIVERPRQSVVVTKEVEYVKVVLANGQIITEGNKDTIRSGSVKYVVYPEGGPLKIEIDNEIIEGADLDINYRIKIENKSELDYNNLNYYRYGAGDNNKYKTNLVKLTLDTIADYVDENLSLTYDIEDSNSNFVYYNPNGNIIKDKWQLLAGNGHRDNNTNMIAGVDISPSVYAHIKNRSNIVVRNTDIILSPISSAGDTYVEIDLAAKKKLTSIINNDNTFNNYIELIKVSNSVGRFYGQMTNNTWGLKTPGNFDVTTLANIGEYDTNTNSNNAKVTILPPTGDKTVYYYIVGLGCLIVLLGGIIIIKKKVL